MLVTGHSSSFPGCLSTILTLTVPLEDRVMRFREEFTHSVEEVRSRLTHLLGRADEMDQQTAILGQRADVVEREMGEVQQQTSDISEKLETSVTECGRRVTEVEGQALRLELRTTLLESHDSAAVARNMEVLAQQMEEMKERLSLAESDAAKAKIASEDLQQQQQQQQARVSERLAESERKALLERLLSLERRFESSFPDEPGQPLRSFSHP